MSGRLIRGTIGQGDIEMLPKLLFAFALACLPAVPAAAAAAPHDTAVAQAARQFTQARHTVERHSGAQGFEIDDTPGAAAALTAQWAAARRLVVALLDRQPGLSPAALANLASRAAGLRLEIVRLDRASLLVAAQSGQVGTAFLLHREAGGRYRPALMLDQPSNGQGDSAPELAAWRPERAGKSCRARRAASAWAQCGPIAADHLIHLPDEVGGARRFALVGVYVTPAGGTVPYQLSIWRWDGRTATPLSLRTFSQFVEAPALVGQGPRGFTLHVKGAFQSFSTCDGCAGRQMEWRFELPPAGVAPPIVRSLAPELDLIDRLYARLASGKPAADLAAPSVLSALRGRTEAGMVGPWRLLSQRAGVNTLCVDSISFERPQIFRIISREGRPWVAGMTLGAAHACNGPGSAL